MSTIIDLIATEQATASTSGLFPTVTFTAGTMSVVIPGCDGCSPMVWVYSTVTGYDGVEIEKVVFRVQTATNTGPDRTSDIPVNNGFSIPPLYGGAYPGAPYDTTLSTGVDITVTPSSTVYHGSGISFLFGVFDNNFSISGPYQDGGLLVISKLELHLVSGDAERFWTSRNFTTERDL